MPRQFWTGAKPARWAQPARECTNFIAAAGYDVVDRILPEEGSCRRRYGPPLCHDLRQSGSALRLCDRTRTVGTASSTFETSPDHGTNRQVEQGGPDQAANAGVEGRGEGAIRHQLRVGCGESARNPAHGAHQTAEGPNGTGVVETDETGDERRGNHL